MEPDIRTAIIFPWETCQDSRVKGTINNDVERPAMLPQANKITWDVLQELLKSVSGPIAPLPEI
ncbi:hypothetical protein BpHYR1_033257 [Brachionus plicatilis]|uniref:Uncharacterized protein n=1 Tax=Brachionus plicatilis TaxID=10195 RepID=A0A3M7RD79_BRAPC|nr:hypothetical protein BpHYR1_033257 [Brachionus plicatilis]